MSLCCWSAALADQTKISDVVVSGNRRFESSAIFNVIKSKAGEQLNDDKIDDDIRAIFALGYFSDVQAKTDSTSNGILLTYVVTEKPILREITFDGNKALSTEKLKEAMELKVNSIFSPKELLKSIAKIKKLYTDEGYSQVEIEPIEVRTPANEIQLTLKISDGDKILVREIRFIGNTAFSAGTLRDLMETKQKWWLAWLTGAGIYKEDVLKNDMLLLSEHYMNNGYINFKLGEPKVELTPDRKGLLITVTMTEGDKFTVGHLDFKGDLLESKEELAKRLKMKTGEIFSRGALRQEIFTLTDLYADKGYAFANVNPLVHINAELKTIDIVFDFEKGEKVYIDRINIAGNAKTRDKVIRRELRVDEGDLYSATGIKKSKQNLMNLGYFEDVTLATAKSKEDNRLNIDVNVKEKATGTFSIGGGYSSLDGIVGQGSIQQSNLFGYGIKANASISIGKKSSTYNLGVTDPYFLDSKWSLGGDVYRSEREYVDYTKRSTGGDIKGGYQLTDTLSTFLLYKYEKYDIFKESAALLETRRLYPDIVSENDGTTSSVTASISRNTTDYRLDPSSGMTNSLSVEFAGLGGTSRFLRYITQTSQYVPVGFGTVFMLRGTFGYIQEIGKKISIDEKFYLGGINTIRGYASRTVSPYVLTTTYDVIGNVNGQQRAYIGGDTEVVFNAEYTVPLLKDSGVKGVVFFDVGNAVDGIGKAFSGMLSSYGLGIRWASPIGPLRLEYGIPINPRADIDKKGKLEFSIGSFF